MTERDAGVSPRASAAGTGAPRADAAGTTELRGRARTAIAAWCLYDFGNSAFPTVIVTFLFGAYVARAVAPDIESGTAAWGHAMTISGLAVALMSPIVGAIADAGGRRKPWIAVLTAIAVVATALLWYVRPEPGSLAFALIAVAIASFGFELALVFYNAMLLQVAPQRLLGRVSGWGWAAGYAGGLLCLALSLVLFVQADPPPFGLDMAAAEPVRIAGPLVALWFALFALPLFFFVPDRKPTGRGFADAASVGILSLWATLRQVRRYGNAARFLLAQMLYLDGLHTLFVFGGIYAAGSFGMGFDEILVFGVLLNIASGIGAVGFAWVDDRLGSKPTIVIGLIALIALGIAILLVTDKTWFYALAIAIGIFLGPVQSASRSMMAHLAPASLATQFFGLAALAGKATAFIGPMMVAWLTIGFSSQRVGMATIPILLAIGLALLLTVRMPKRPGAEPPAP
jgi:UMF1 family MFS transporter